MMKVEIVLNFINYHIKPVSLDANCEVPDQSFRIRVYPFCYSETCAFGSGEVLVWQWSVVVVVRCRRPLSSSVHTFKEFISNFDQISVKSSSGREKGCIRLLG